MAIRYNKNVMGTITIKQGENKFKVQIRQGNCLAVFIFGNGTGARLLNIS